MSEVNNGANNGANNGVDVVVVKQKRGRKSKKELELLAAEKKNGVNNITCVIEDNNSLNNDLTNVVSNALNNDLTNVASNDFNNNDISNNNLINEIINNTETSNTEEKPVAKKRGRKPKGGKIIQQVVSVNDNKDVKPNVILHLKCSLNDLQSTTINTNIESFNFSSCKNEISYEIIGDNDLLNTPPPPSNISKNNNTTSFNNQLGSNNVFSNNANTMFNNNSLFDNNFSSNFNNTNTFNSKIYDDKYNYNDDDTSVSNKEVETRELWKKLKQLEHNLHINNISNKKSACFWCTCDFDSPPVYIPKFQIKDSYHVYGCFCSPECSTAYLMEENIDSSTKFERYHLINHIYSKIYNYTKNIKPSPNPYYMLDKYYGNLSIQEYRSLLRNERLFLIVDKPLTRILPELHEDNDDFIINNKIIPSNTYQIKKTVQKKTQSKSNIMNEKFGLIQ
jgi:hypothetical protein